MKEVNQNMEEWIPLSEAAQCSIYSKRQIQKLAEKGNQRIRTKQAEDDKHILYNKKDILQYAAAHPRDTILDTVWDEFDYIEGECFYPLFGYDYKYFISNKLRVVNISRGQILTPQAKTDTKGNKTGYMQVTTTKNGKSKCELLHRLVGITQCPNSLKKNDCFHHINICQPADNRAVNLLPVWESQHNELHMLLREKKIAEYNEMIKAIKKENKQKIYKIPHLDYKSNERYNYFMFVTSKGYKAYREGKEVSLDSIVMEIAELKEPIN